MIQTITTCVFVITQTISGLIFNQLQHILKLYKNIHCKQKKSIKHPNEVQTVQKKLIHSADPVLRINFLHTGWAKSRYTVINYILYTYFWPTLYIHYMESLQRLNLEH